MNDADVIKRFGTAEALAADFAAATEIELTRSAIYEWKRNGIPRRYRKFLARIAEEKGVQLPQGFLDLRPEAHRLAKPRKSKPKRKNGRRAV